MEPLVPGPSAPLVSCPDVLAELRTRIQQSAARTPGEVLDLLCADQLERWMRGERIPAEEYLRLHPHPDEGFELVFSEVVFREEANELPTLGEYQARFPQFADALDRQFSLHRALGAANGESEPSPVARAFTESPPTIPGYEILGKLGQGGMGIVYKARQLSLNRLVALKLILHPGVPEGSAVLSRFYNEAEAVSRLQHPHIIQVHDVGTAGGRPFIAFELVEGGSLADHLRHASLTPRAAARLLETLAWAINAMHQRGVIHRDLKPANVLLGSPLEGAANPDAFPFMPRIADFGLAKLLGSQDGPTQSGDVLGTPSYVAPEQITRATGEVGPPADVYSLGAILYELLTGRPPFHGATALEVLFQATHYEPVSPSRIQPRLPRDLVTICMKCLEKRPGKRYPTAAALAEDLHRYLNGVPVRVRPISPVGRVLRLASRRPVGASLVALLVVVTVVGLVGILWEWRSARLAQAEAEVNLYYSRIAQAQLRWQTSDITGAEALLARCVPTPGLPDRRGWEWSYLRRTCRPERRTLPHHSWVFGVAVSPNGREVAAVSGVPNYVTATKGEVVGELRVWDVEEGRLLLAHSSLDHPLTGVAYSPDGKTIAITAGLGGVRLIDRQTGEIRLVLSVRPRYAAATALVGQLSAGSLGHGLFPALLNLLPGTTDERLSGLAFRPDGTQLATTSSAGVFQVWDAASGQQVVALPNQGNYCYLPAISRDSRWLAFAALTGVRTWDLERGTWGSFFSLGKSRVQAVAYGPEEGKLAAGDEHGVGHVWDSPEGPLHSLQGHNGPIYAVAWSPDGKLVATAGADHSIRLWDPVRGLGVAVLRGHVFAVRSLAFTPDGRTLISGGLDATVKLWDVGRDPRGRKFPSKGDVSSLTFLPGGRLQSASPGGRLLTWDLETGANLGASALPTGSLRGYPVQDAVYLLQPSRLAAISRDDGTKLTIWDVETGEEKAALRGHSQRISALAASADGRLVVSAAGDPQQSPHVEVIGWDADTGGSRFRLSGLRWSVRSLAISPDRQLVALGAYQGRDQSAELCVWDTAAGRELYQDNGHKGLVGALAFSPNGRQLASVGFDDRLQLRDARTGRLHSTLQAPRSPTGLAYSPDGRRLAVIGYDGEIHLYDPERGQEIVTLTGLVRQRHEDRAYNARVAFSADGHWLASTNWDGSVNLYDGRPLGSGGAGVE